MLNPSEEFLDLIARCRNTCLWFFALDQVPVGRAAQLYSLDCVERYGSLEDFVKARKLRQWLSQHSNESFAVS